MANMEIQGKIIKIGPVQTVGQNGFQRRDVVIMTEDQYPQYIPFDFVQEKCSLLDNFHEGQVVLISYNTEQAKALYKVAPEMLLSVSVRNNDELERILQTGIPKEKLVAFTGIKVAPDALYQRLNELKIPAILGTLGNLDKRAAAKGDHLYKEWAQKGIQIFSTDRPLSLSF